MAGTSGTTTKTARGTRGRSTRAATAPHQGAGSADEHKRAAPTGGEAVEAVRRDLARLPTYLAESALAASALAMAREIDSALNSATAKSMCARALQDAMRELRELAPPEERKDAIDEIGEKRAQRRARLADAKD